MKAPLPSLRTLRAGAARGALELRPPAPIPFICLGILACGGERAADAGWCRDGLSANAEAVVARGEGAWARAGRTPRLVERWRAGGTTEGEELAFPIGIAASPDGWIAIPDWLLGEAIVVAPDGSWRGSWTRRGEGPGEVRRPVAAAWSEDGTLAVFDIGASKVVWVREREPVREALPLSPRFTGPVVASGELEWAGLAFDGTAYLQRPPHPPDPSAAAEEPGARLQSAVLRLRPGVDVPDTVATTTVPVLGAGPLSSLPAPGWPRLRAALGPAGALAIGGLDSLYRIDVHRWAASRTGAPGEEAGAGEGGVGARGPGSERGLLRVCRAAPPLPLTAAELGEAPEPTLPAPYGHLFLGAGGRLWVQRERPTGAGLWTEPGARFDVFDPDGAYLGEVWAPERARLLAAAGDTVWAFETGEYDETWVVAYEVEVR